jgi:hypothetical protein
MFALAIYAAIVTGLLAAHQRGEAGAGARLLRPWPVSTTVALLVIGTVSTVQLTWVPSLQTRLERDRAALTSGQVWRLVTALTVQDGAVAGTVFNLVALALIGVVAECLLGHRRWLPSEGRPLSPSSWPWAGSPWAPETPWGSPGCAERSSAWRSGAHPHPCPLCTGLLRLLS